MVFSVKPEVWIEVDLSNTQTISVVSSEAFLEGFFFAAAFLVGAAFFAVAFLVGAFFTGVDFFVVVFMI